MQNDSRTKPVIAMYTAEYSVNGFKSLHLKESVLADGTLSLPALKGRVSRGKIDETERTSVLGRRRGLAVSLAIGGI